MLIWKNKKLEKGQIRGKIIKNGTAYAVLLLALVAMTFFGVCTPRGSQNFMPQSGQPAEVAGESVSFAEFKMAYSRFENYYKAIYQDQYDAAKVNMSKIVLDSLVQGRVVAEMAKSLGVAADETEIKKEILNQFKDEKGVFNSERFAEYLRYSGLSERDLYMDFDRQKRQARLQVLMSEIGYASPDLVNLRNKISGLKMNIEYAKIASSDIKVSVTQDDVNKFLADSATEAKLKEKYEKGLSQYKKEKKVKARHLLVAYEGARRASERLKGVTKEAAQAKAEGLLKQAQSANLTAFTDLVKKNTDEESGKKSGGDLGFFKAGDMAKEFSDAAFAMKKGDTSGVVESPFGFHIIRVEDIEEAKETTFDEAKIELAKQLLVETKQPDIAASRAKELTDAASVSLSAIESKLRELGMKWEETGSFSPLEYSIPKLGSDKEFYDALNSMKTAGQVFPTALKVRDQFYVLRLKAISHEAPKEEADSDKTSQELNQKLFAELSSKYKETLEKSGKIVVNEEIRNLSQRNSEKAEQ